MSDCWPEARLRRAWEARLAEWNAQQEAELNSKVIQKIRRRENIEQQIRAAIEKLVFAGDAEGLGEALIEAIKLLEEDADS